MTTPFIIAACITLLSVPLHLLAEKSGWRRIRAVTKTTASLGYVGAAVAAGATGSVFGLFILAGLVISLSGDLLLLSRQRAPLMAGIAAFLLAQAAYVTAFVIHGLAPWYTAAALLVAAAAAVAVFRWLKKSVPREFMAPVLAYIAVISLMVASAVGAVGRAAPARLLLGALLFYISDIYVARDRFVAKELKNRLLGYPLYNAGQLLIASCAGIWMG
jgi:uncharacterized membrane protein YhhN